MQIQLEGRTILVTGGSSGIGEAVARRAAEVGANVAILGRRAAPLERGEASTGAFVIPGDVSRPEDARQAVEETVGRFGRLHGLVNCAGVIGSGGTADTPIEEWERIMRINLDGTVNMCRAAIDPLRAADGGSIVNISSICGSRPFSQVTAYCVSKAAVDMYTECLALELAEHNIRVNAVSPGVVVTHLHTVTNAVEDYDAFLARGKQTHPLGFVAEPDDIAWQVLFLLSDKARWTTGANFTLDGGRSCLSAR